MRLKTNPELRKLLKTKPDMFVYGEAETPSTQNLYIDGYCCYLHKSKLEIDGNLRRGLALFYRTKYRFLISIEYTSQKYDIVWIKLKTTGETVYFCFFYAPGSHHSLEIRNKFYDHFSSAYLKFSSLGKVYLIGDTNARLGSILNDRNVHGQLISNANKSLFLEFLDFSGLVILNKRYCWGASTYEIVNRKRSIIDLCLTNTPENVLDFKIEPIPFGVNSQTCHKALTATISVLLSVKTPPLIPRRTSFGRISAVKRKKITASVTTAIENCKTRNSYDYDTLTKIFTNVKRSILGVKRIGQKFSPVSAALRDLQTRYSEALVNLNIERSEFSYFVADNLEKLLNEQFRLEKNRKFSIWLRKMNDLDFQSRTRAFFAEIRSRQQTREEPVPILGKDGTLSDNLQDTLKNWTEYYENLYCDNSEFSEPNIFPTPDAHEHLDKDLSLTEFVDVIYELKHYKSPGYDQILNEDITAAVMEGNCNDNDIPSPVNKIILLEYIFKILSDFWFNECVPHDFKRTILRPFLKKTDEPSWDPSNYRPISLLNTLMKIYEGIICRRLVNFLNINGFFSPTQAAYRKGRSTADHIFVLHELFLEYRYNTLGPRGGRVRKSLFFCFLDFKKAFDTVPRHILFTKLNNAGIRGKMLRVIMDLFSSNRANVLIDDYLSPEFFINRGVLQGSKLGPILFNVFINDLLNELDEAGLGAEIGPIRIPTLGFADDIVLISDCPKKLQALIDICQSWASRNGMAFNVSKCKVMVFNNPPKGVTFTLNNTKLKIVDSYKYLGAILSSKYITNLFRKHYADIAERATIKAAIISRHGFHEDGLRLHTAVRLYKLVIRPVLEYSAQTLTYGRYSQSSSTAEPVGFAKELEHRQTQILKRLINCPRSTSPSIVRLFCGVEPLSCRFEILKLRYFWKTLKCRENTITRRLLDHRRSTILEFDMGFAHEAHNICRKYNIPYFWNGNAANHINPLRAISRIITSQNLQEDLEKGRLNSCPFTKIFLSDPTQYQKGYHLPDLFLQPDCFEKPNGRKRVVKALLHPCSYYVECSLCHRNYRDKFSHYLADCSRISGFRREFLLKLKLYDFSMHRIPMTKIDFLSEILWNKTWRKCLSKFLVDIDF